jgi:hypothetical protein
MSMAIGDAHASQMMIKARSIIASTPCPKDGALQSGRMPSLGMGSIAASFLRHVYDASGEKRVASQETNLRRHPV